MRITGFIGSPRKKGNTDLLVQKMLEGASDNGAKTQIIYLNDLNIRECQACNKCKETPIRCAIEDDMQELYPIIESSDVLILGSPIYMGYITGIMKTFMDRWHAYSGASEEKRLPVGKRIHLVLPYARPEKDVFNYVAKQVGQSFKFVFGAKVTSTLVARAGDKGSVLQQEDTMKQAWETGAALARETGMN